MFVRIIKINTMLMMIIHEFCYFFIFLHKCCIFLNKTVMYSIKWEKKGGGR